MKINPEKLEEEIELIIPRKGFLKKNPGEKKGRRTNFRRSCRSSPSANPCFTRKCSSL